RLPEEGTDLDCHPTFIRNRARQELRRIEDRLLSTDLQPPEPQFCYADPFVIDLAQPTKTLEVYGYDFDTKPLELFILNADGTFEDVSFALKNKSHTHVTVDLSTNGVKFSPRSQMLSVAWGHIVRYSVSLIHSTTDLCSSQIEEIPSGKSISFSPDRISGSPSLNEKAVAQTNAVLNYEADKIEAMVCTLATDSKSDPTTFAGCSVEYVYTTDPERVIDGVFMPLESRSSGMHLHPGSNTFPGRGSGPVSKWIFDIPDSQSKSNAEPAVTAVLGRIRIASTKVENCLPAVAYVEARRRSDMAASTVRRLDSQSKAIPKEILKLRPRFAP
ncbi:MAG TPA: hypothetical protein VFO86_07305, partial [Terriglobia bacterium]|nr:hypothetical protein [Terriglobia bacterium]